MTTIGRVRMKLPMLLKVFPAEDGDLFIVQVGEGGRGGPARPGGICKHRTYKSFPKLPKQDKALCSCQVSILFLVQISATGVLDFSD